MAFYVDRAFYSRDAAANLWKLTVVSSNSDPLAELEWGMLYNLSTDPGETTDLIREPEITRAPGNYAGGIYRSGVTVATPSTVSASAL